MEWLIAALVTLGVNGIMNTIDAFEGKEQDNAQIDAYTEEIKRREAEKTDKLSLMDLEFTDKKETAEKNAARSDAQSDMNELQSEEDANRNINNLGLQQIADAYTWNMASQQIGSQKGDALSQAAASGARTSSMTGAIDMADQQAKGQLQLQEDLARADYDNTLYSTLGALAQNRFQIQANRTDAYDLRRSFQEGGSNYNIYQKQRKMQEDAYDWNIKDLTDAKNDLSDNLNTNFWKRIFGVQNMGTAIQMGQFAKDFDFDFAKLDTDTKFKFNLKKGKSADNLGGY